MIEILSPESAEAEIRRTTEMKPGEKIEVATDVKSIYNQSIGVSVKTPAVMQNGFNYAKSLDVTEKGMSVRTPTPEPDIESQGVSVMTKQTKMVSQALSVKSITEKSVRDIDGQVTEGRFEPELFHEGCQTDKDLILSYLKVPVESHDQVTEPVNIKEFTKFSLAFCQTDPEIEEPHTLEEPESIQKPAECGIDGKPGDELLLEPLAEKLYAL